MAETKLLWEGGRQVKYFRILCQPAKTLTPLYFFRTVSQMEGQQLANQFDCTFRETSAAEDFESVERVFNSLVRDVLHSKERQLPLQPLFISEDKTSLLGSSAQGAFGNGAGRVRRTKSPKAIDSKDKKDEKEQRAFPRRIEKIFNKSFKIFN